MGFDEAALLAYGKAHGWWRSGAGFAYQCNHQLFRDVPIRGRSFLDIGCGNGQWVLWAKSQGAGLAVGIEPSAGGSTSGAPLRFRQAIGELALEETHLVECTFEEYDVPAPFDVVLLNDVVNHMNQELCEKLPDDPEAIDAYIETFRALRRIVADGGHIVVTDCSSKNFWGDNRSPWLPRVRFSVHQPPEVWQALLERAGFRMLRTSWANWPRYHHFSKLLDNAWIAYFTHSHFILQLQAV